MSDQQPIETRGASNAHCVGSSGSPFLLRFNINEYVRVKLTPRGRAIHRAQHDDLSARFPSAKFTYSAPVEDADGWSQWQAWTLMETFGQHVGMGFELPFETTIEILANKPSDNPRQSG